MAVKKGDTIRLHYTVKMENGEVFDSSVSGEPIRFEVGRGEVIEGIEEEVVGMKVGEKKEISVAPEKGFGQRKEDLVQKAPREILREREVAEGDIVDLRSADGRVARAQVVNVAKDSVTFDLNHPLAGRTVILQIELVEIA